MWENQRVLIKILDDFSLSQTTEETLLEDSQARAPENLPFPFNFFIFPLFYLNFDQHVTKKRDHGPPFT